jgi:tRNA U34 5-carboxymethylaminomethyl modifying GTPase MnmE/TrmE
MATARCCGTPAAADRRCGRALVSGPASATGEDVAEFHVHGGRRVGGAVCGAIRVLGYMRAAEPASSPARAFENGKLDLTGSEGLDDLIHADTDRQRRQALRQLKACSAIARATGARRSSRPRR